MTLGTKLNKLRTARNLTQMQIAEQLHISQNAYNKWESDKAKPAMENLMKIADFYETDVYDLLDESPIVQNNTDRAVGNIHNNNTVTINNSFSEELVESIIKNQQDITKLVEAQNKLIESLLKK
ncbi:MULTISPECIES: helix-turn-helix domain-containing protein [Chryseobacterium]|uniref:Transcriptional repressor DicA n=1 Tax=Chryseobacterium taihuense TaxID=1141221 RepID=A0A4U8WM26_9FLAO|nr:MULTISPECIES: helix-turn-helix domain-containing protein [Chryseobacterium]QQV03358.1 helix-turn-helix transcriptional regulator [Chryseobacterium sp. FDAARGOS 1104]VFB03329.1 transcriptional repressor DicA [Chryseobacterium taihuense]